MLNAMDDVFFIHRIEHDEIDVTLSRWLRLSICHQSERGNTGLQHDQRVVSLQNHVFNRTPGPDYFRL